MASTPEGRVKAGIKKWLDGHGFWRAGAKKPAGEIVGWYYMPVSNGMGVHGIPDFPTVYKGRAIYIEAKAPGKSPTPNQINRMDEIRAAGGEAHVVDDPSQLEQIFLD
jgi:hypothetical protein